MKCFTLKQAKNHVEYTLIVHGNNYGDQVIYIEHEMLDGRRFTVYQEINHEGSHRTISPEYVGQMREYVEFWSNPAF